MKLVVIKLFSQVLFVPNKRVFRLRVNYVIEVLLVLNKWVFPVEAGL